MENNYSKRGGKGHQPKGPKEIMMRYDMDRATCKLAGVLIGSMLSIPFFIWVLFL